MIFGKDSGKTFPCMTPRGCPERVLKPGQEGFCPVWTDSTIEEENVLTREKRLMRGCMFQLMPRMMEHVIHASNRPAAEIGQLRTEMAHAVVNGIANFLAQADQDLISDAIENVRRQQVTQQVTHGAGNGADDSASEKR